MSKARSDRLWTLVKDFDKGTIGFYREKIPYLVFSMAEWSALISQPVIKGTDPDAKQDDPLPAGDSLPPSDCAC